MAIWVIKDGQREGPYEEQDVRELIYEGTYSDAELAIRDGETDWSTLGQMLGRNKPAEDLPATPADPPMEPTVPPPPVPPTAPPATEARSAEPEPAGAPVVPTPPAEPPPVPATVNPAPLEPISTAPRPIRVSVVDFNMPFGSMVVLMVKWVLASIPALLIIATVAVLFWIAFFALIATSAVFHR